MLLIDKDDALKGSHAYAVSIQCYKHGEYSFHASAWTWADSAYDAKQKIVSWLKPETKEAIVTLNIVQFGTFTSAYHERLQGDQLCLGK